MKSWTGFDSEHSMSLVMIGQFKEEADAGKCRQIIERLKGQTVEDEAAGHLDRALEVGKFTEGMRSLLKDQNLWNFRADEIGQFAWDVSVDQAGKTIRITTDEPDVSAFLKLLLESGAKVEVFSAHDHPEGQD